MPRQEQALEIHSAHSTSHGRATTFEEELREYLKKAPWLAASAVFHMAVFLILMQFPWQVMGPRNEVCSFTATVSKQDIDPIDQQEPEQQEKRKIEEQEAQLEDPIVSDLEVTEDIIQEIDLPPINNPFDGPGKNDVIGVSGGGGGPGGNGRRGLLAGRLGPTASQRVVERGLEWLGRHQDPHGFWSCASFSDMCQTNRCDGAGDQMHDVGVTGLALLAFLGSGNTASHGRYKDVVRKGLKFLVDLQDPETGCFGEVNSHQAFLYDHALAALAMTEGYGLCKWPLLKEPAQKGINFIHSARNPYKAWRYAYPPDGNNDMSITGWMVMALKSAEDFGLKVDHSALEGARFYLDEMTDENTGRTGYLSKGGYSAREPGMAERWPETKTEAITAVGMLCRIFLGEDPEKSPALRGGADLLRKQLPLWDEKAGTIDYYYWYYGSYAMFQLGGKDWEKWQARMLDTVIKTQRQDGDEIGSWDPQFDPWGHRGGRVYSTAIMTLCLEVYYRYDRVLGAR
ncbi:MAG: prenyltransferase/squalene oxidase repeat-containing protein [Planctomycetota bacterium]